MVETRKIARGNNRRQVIMDAAYALFIKQGFAATSMRDIAHQSHIAVGSIYNHFASKENVFEAIVAERHPFLEIIPLLTSVVGADAESFVRNAARALVDELGRHPGFLNLMLIEIVEFEGRHVPMLTGRLLPLVTSLSERLRSSAVDDRSIPPLVLARAFLGMFFSYYITDRLLGRAMPAGMSQAAMDHFVDIFLHGVLKEARA